MRKEYAPNTFQSSSAKRKAQLKYNRGRLPLAELLYGESQDFRCAHCHQHVSADPLLSGVNNRNHCPYCLCSRHLDLLEAGDRLAACKAPMHPIGLTLKRTRKKYGREKDGELMLVHWCSGCGKASINRIAADDDPEAIVAAFEGSFRLDPGVRAKLDAGGVRLLEPEDAWVVQAQLFGQGSHLEVGLSRC